MKNRNDDVHALKLVRPSAEIDHDFAVGQLPWFLAQTLDAQTERRVREHVEGCARCREACAQETDWMAAMRAMPVVDLAPQAALSRLMQRIDAREQRRARFAWLLRPWTAVKNTRTLVLATAVQAAAIVSLVALVGVMLVREPVAKDYRTLSNPAPALPVDVPQLRLVFDDRLTSIEIRALLDQVNGRIVDGPGPQGIFTVALPRGAGQADDAVQTAVQWLRARPGVRLAEIVSH